MPGEMYSHVARCTLGSTMAEMLAAGDGEGEGGA